MLAPQSAISSSQSAISNQQSAIFAACFCLAWLPFAAQFVAFHPDERHYTDAAAQMVLEGGYLTPRTPEGYLRFNKPVLTYWLLVPWYHTLGISPLAGRLSFLLLSAGIVWMTHRTALLVTENRRAAMLAAAIMATHAPLLSVAVNSIPEVPLTLCWLLCAYGLLGIVALGRREPLYYWAAYGGAGLGVAVKGMPILLLVGYAVLFAALNPWRRTSLRELVHLPSMIAGTAIGLAWYVAMFALHGQESLSMFVSDQVTERVGLSPGTFGKNIALVVAGYALSFLPWTLPLVFRRRSAVLPNHDAPTTTFIMGWALAMGLVIALVERFALRYLLAATPLLAIVVADRLNRLQGAGIEAWWRWSGYAVAAIIVLFAAATCAIRYQLEASVAASIVGCLVAGLGVWLCTQRSSWLAEPFARLTLAALTLPPLAFLGIEPIALPDSGDALARRLRSSDWLADSEFAYVGNPALASKTRVMLRGDMRLLALDDREDLAVADYRTLLVRSDDLPHIERENFVRVADFSAGLGKLDPLALLAATRTGTLREYLDEHQQRFVLVRSVPGEGNSELADRRASTEPARRNKSMLQR